MSFLSSIFGAGIEGAAKGIGSLAKDIEEVFTLSDREKLEQFKAETERLKITQATDLAQIEVNKVEAAHKSIFVAGWRPFIGWICGFAMLYHFLFFPIVGPFMDDLTGIPLLDLDWQELAVPLLGMLGMGGLRTYEKAKGVAREK